MTAARKTGERSSLDDYGRGSDIYSVSRHHGQIKGAAILPGIVTGRPGPLRRPKMNFICRMIYKMVTAPCCDKGNGIKAKERRLAEINITTA